MRQFIHEAFHHEAHDGSFNRPPPGARHAECRRQIFEFVAFSKIRRLGGAAELRRFRGGFRIEPFGDIGVDVILVPPASDVAVRSIAPLIRW